MSTFEDEMAAQQRYASVLRADQDTAARRREDQVRRGADEAAKALPELLKAARALTKTTPTRGPLPKPEGVRSDFERRMFNRGVFTGWWIGPWIFVKPTAEVFGKRPGDDGSKLLPIQQWAKEGHWWWKVQAGDSHRQQEHELDAGERVRLAVRVIAAHLNGAPLEQALIGISPTRETGIVTSLQDATIDEPIMSNGMVERVPRTYLVYFVRTARGREVSALLSPALQQSFTRVTPGDQVEVEFSHESDRVGRIVQRLSSQSAPAGNAPA